MNPELRIPTARSGDVDAVRILFGFVGGHGHFEPLVPVARACAAAGHTVAFGCAPAMRATVEAAGFAVFALGAPSPGAPQRLPLRPVDREREARELRERFVERAARHRVPLVRDLCRAWSPDVVVCDETDFGAMLAAECLGLPFATVHVIAAGSFVRPEVVGEALDALRAAHGLAPDPELAMPGRHLVLSPFPERLRDPAHPLPATAQRFRPPRPAPGPAPAWARVLPAAPAVYLTLGTVFHLESGDLLERALAGLRELPANVLVTVGPHRHAEELGPQPAHVRVAQYVPQEAVLPHCDLVVSHGGSGSVLGALAHGLPLVLLPLGADQPLNADRCAALGVAEVLDALEATPERVRRAASAVLGDPTARRAAAALRDEIASQPEMDRAVAALAGLTAGRRPHPA